MASVGMTLRRGGRALPLLLLSAMTLWSLRTLTPGPAQVSTVRTMEAGGGIPADTFKEDTMMSKIKDLVTAHESKLAALAYVVVFLVAKREPANKDEVKAGALEARADYRTVLWMSAYLSLLSGIVNAIAIIEMGGTVAHHTGNASHVGRLAGTDGARFLALMVAYLFGAAVQGYCSSDGEALYRGKYSPGLLGAAVAVAAGTGIHYCSGNALVALPLLSFSQGLQNAITRKCSSLPVCTTHMTGYLTDAGAGVGIWMKSGGKEPLSVRTKFFLLSIFAFVAGGTAAKMMRDVVGVSAAFVPAVLMAISALGIAPLSAKKTK